MVIARVQSVLWFEVKVQYQSTRSGVRRGELAYVLSTRSQHGAPSTGAAQGGMKVRTALGVEKGGNETYVFFEGAQVRGSYSISYPI